MVAQRTSNKSTRIFIWILALAFLAWTFYQNRKPHTEAGRLEYRMVTGEKDGSFQVIMLETADRFTVLDSLYRDIFTDNGEEVVTRPEQLQLLEHYKNIQYRAGVNVTEKNRKVMYRTSRELFNQLKFNEPLQVEVNRKVTDSLNRIIR